MDREGSCKVKLSVIIVNYGTWNLTRDCIRSIYDFRPRCSFEIVLIDNSSGEIDPVELSAFPEVRLIRMGSNEGFSKANNIGIYNSYGDFIVLLNSDTCIFENTFDRMLLYMDNEKNRKVGVLGPRQVDERRNFKMSCGAFPTFFTELGRKICHYRLSLKDYSFRDYLDARHSERSDVDWVSGSCMMMRRTALFDTGLLDENFFMYFEDIDLCARFAAKGWAVRYFPETTIVHYGGYSAKKNLMLAMTEYRKSEIYFAGKYYKWYGEAAIRVFLFIKYGFHFFRHLFSVVLLKLFGRRTGDSYLYMLLSKKVIEKTLGSVNKISAEPALPKLY